MDKQQRGFENNLDEDEDHHKQTDARTGNEVTDIDENVAMTESKGTGNDESIQNEESEVTGNGGNDGKKSNEGTGVSGNDAKKENESNGDGGHDANKESECTVDGGNGAKKGSKCTDDGESIQNEETEGNGNCGNDARESSGGTDDGGNDAMKSNEGTGNCGSIEKKESKCTDNDENDSKRKGKGRADDRSDARKRNVGTANDRKDATEESQGTDNDVHINTEEHKKHKRQGGDEMNDYGAVNDDNGQKGQKSGNDNAKHGHNGNQCGTDKENSSLQPGGSECVVKNEEIEQKGDGIGSDNHNIGKEKIESGATNGQRGQGLNDSGNGLPEAGHGTSTCDSNKVPNVQQGTQMTKQGTSDCISSKAGNQNNTQDEEWVLVEKKSVQGGGGPRGKDQKPHRSDQNNDRTSDETKDIKIKELNERIKELEETIGEQKKKMTSKENIAERLRNELDKANDELQSQKTAREIEHKDLTRTIKELAAKTVNMEGLETKLREECATVKMKEQVLKELDKKNEKLNKQLADAERKLTGQESANRDLFKKQIGLQQENQDRTKELKKTKKIIKEYEAQLTQKGNMYHQQGVLLQQHKQQIHQQNQQIQQYISYSNKLQKDLDDSEERRYELTLRLSKLAGAQLTGNNPNIADLSDINRPTKLAEKYSELYDNEWTDAYEDLNETSGTDEQTRINKLLELLKASYDECVQLSEPFRDTLKSLTTVTLRVKGTQENCERDEIKQNQNTNTTVVHRSVQTDSDRTEPEVSKEGKIDNQDLEEISGRRIMDDEQNIHSNDTINGNKEEVRKEEKMETDALEDKPSTQINVQPSSSIKDLESDEKTATEAMEVDKAAHETSTNPDNDAVIHYNPSCETATDMTSPPPGFSSNDDTGEQQGPNTTGSLKTGAAVGDEQSPQKHNTDGAASHVDGTTDPVSQVVKELGPPQEGNTEQNLEHRGQQQGQGTASSLKTGAAVGDEHSLQNHNTDGAASHVDGTTDPLSQVDKRLDHPLHERSTEQDLEHRGPATGKANLPPGFSSNVDTGEITAEVKVKVEFTAEQKKTVSDMKKVCGKKLEEEMGLSKVIAQKIAFDRNINAEKHVPIMAYLTKCAELCWLMMIQEPPVVIGFHDAKEGEPFNKDTYKAYTKTGKRLDFIVWPPLYLHKDGPMLSKGCAQGAN